MNYLSDRKRMRKSMAFATLLAIAGASAAPMANAEAGSSSCEFWKLGRQDTYFAYVNRYAKCAVAGDFDPDAGCAKSAHEKYLVMAAKAEAACS